MYNIRPYNQSVIASCPNSTIKMRCVLEDTRKCLLHFSAQNLGGGLIKIMVSPANSMFVGIDFL